MTRLASSNPPGASPASMFLSIVALLVLAAPAFAQAPLALPPAAPAPLEAYTDPSWTGRPQPVPVLRKEAAAALAEGRRRCAAQNSPEQRSECLRIVTSDYRQMMARLERRTSR